MGRISGLHGWLARECALPAFMELENVSPEVEFGGGIGLDLVLPAWESSSAPAESLRSSLRSVHEYLKKALELIDSEIPGYLDSEEAYMIKETLGEPPTLCYPLYLISVGEESSERVVYVRKTSSSCARFRQGHAALTKLLHPKYDGLNKRVYFGAIVLLTDSGDYLPLEWVKPFKLSEQILSSIEAQVIYHFVPELNTHHVRHDNVKWKFPSLHIQNFTGVTEFLDDEWVWAPA